ncbi:MAG: DUF3703 domain-containing protein [Bacteroidetes bacterium]|nr:DUF3703 domain-containing protein [Bacteroidota bacterium]
MKLYTTMPELLKPYFNQEVEMFERSLRNENLPLAWEHLERAHIIGQAYPWEHTLVHLKMLGFGIRIKSTREVVGQIPRLLAGGVKSFVGKIPVGNTGGADVPPLRPMKIPGEIIEIFDRSGTNPYER